MQQATAANRAHTPRRWHDINWRRAAKLVRNLRQRIDRTSRQGDHKKVRSLQRLMLKSQANRIMSVRKVTQLNQGRYTPGVDQVVVKTPAARAKLVAEVATYQPWKAKPARRVSIAKANGKRRPLGILTILDRCMQALVKHALDPEWEAKFEPSSYGFRPGRSGHDAIERIDHIVNPRSRKHWCVDADIQGAFDHIRHPIIEKATAGFPAQALSKQGLKAGVLDQGVFADTATGTPQGGIVSPVLLHIALHGMESALGVQYRKHKDSYMVTGPRAMVRYADDICVFTETREDAEAAQADLDKWLADRGLALSKEKTRLCHLTEGLDFLGFNVRHYPNSATRTGYKLLIKPSNSSVKRCRHRMKQAWTARVGHNVEAVIKALNPRVRGWVNDFRIGVSKETFSGLDDWMWQRVYRGCKRTHPTKPWRGIVNAYVGRHRVGRKGRWVFGNPQTGHHLLKLAWTPIKRHMMVKHDASPDDPDLRAYWQWRDREKSKALPTRRQRELARRQDGQCPVCHDRLHNEEALHVHHLIPNSKGGEDAISNLALVHLYCHQQIHRSRK